MHDAMPRRVFLGRLAVAALTPHAIVRSSPRLTALPGPTLRVGVLTGGADYRARHNGALLGVEEAKHAAELFGGDATLVAIPDVSRIPPNLTAILSDDSEAHCRLLASNTNVITMNVGCPSNQLREEDCSATMFHVFPSEAMIRDARTQARGAAEIVAWDPSLFRFGADTLNGRFEKRFGARMTVASWTAWFAVKALWESSLRMKSAAPQRIVEYLERDTTGFDGHKGRPLSFRPWDHQLRQFLYARVGGKLLDVPANAPSNATSHEFLDRLGTSAASTTCHLKS